MYWCFINTRHASTLNQPTNHPQIITQHKLQLCLHNYPLLVYPFANQHSINNSSSSVLSSQTSLSSSYSLFSLFYHSSFKRVLINNFFTFSSSFTFTHTLCLNPFAIFTLFYTPPFFVRSLVKFSQSLIPCNCILSWKSLSMAVDPIGRPDLAKHALTYGVC